MSALTSFWKNAPDVLMPSAWPIFVIVEAS